MLFFVLCFAVNVRQYGAGAQGGGAHVRPPHHRSPQKRHRRGGTNTRQALQHPRQQEQTQAPGVPQEGVSVFSYCWGQYVHNLKFLENKVQKKNKK